MAFALGLLGHSPAVFWSMTPRELDAAIEGKFGRQRGDTGLDRFRLGDLMRQFPDEVEVI